MSIRGHNLKKYPDWLYGEIRRFYLKNPSMTKYQVWKHYDRLYGVSMPSVYRFLKGVA